MFILSLYIYIAIMTNIIDMKLQELKRLRHIYKEKLHKASSTELRMKWLHQQKVHNSTSEYDRIRALLNESKTKDVNLSKLEERKLALERLGAKAVDRIGY